MLYYLAKTPTAFNSLVEEVCEADRRSELSPLITYEESLKLKYL